MDERRRKAEAPPPSLSLPPSTCLMTNGGGTERERPAQFGQPFPLPQAAYCLEAH